MVENVTFGDQVTAFYHHLRRRNIISAILLYRRIFRNYIKVIIMHRRGRFPIEAVLTNGQRINVKNPNHLFSILLRLDYDPDSDSVKINFKNHNLRLYRGIDNGDIVGIFHNESYSFLPVESKTVIDVGANIGDSALYFACKGAKKVVALEPYENNYEIAMKNIETNTFSNKIELLLAACSNRSGTTRTKRVKGNVFTSLETADTGGNIVLMSLEDIVSKYGIESAVLKMDCEGSEYSIIIDAKEQVLQKFTHIQIEYHYGFRNIRERLQRCGFRVTVSKPMFFFNKYVNKPNMYVGWLYAELNHQ